MKNVKFILSATILFFAQMFSASAQDVESPYMPSGRPGFTTGASLVDNKSLMLESGLGFDNRYCPTTFTINTSTLRYGFAERVEGRFSISEAFMEGGDKGISSLSLAAKIGLVNNGDYKLSVLPQVYLPCSSSVGYSNVHALLNLLYSKKLDDKWSLSANAAARWHNSSEKFGAMAALFVSYAMTDKLSLSAEVYGDGIAEDFTTFNIGVAAAYQIHPRLQLDLSTTRTSESFVRGLADNWSIEAGLCWLIK